jgi:phospholipid/cholesterol/gamma-HCH transport system substrate-binding protein
MSKSRLELKVGVFVLIGLLLLATLVILLSKGTTFFTGTFELRLKSGNVGGIKAGANILLSGVPVGRVSGVELGEEGTNVTIHLKIFSKYHLYESARFEIEQAGFLGDQYVAIYPGTKQGRRLQNGDEVICRNPFNMQETVAQAAETIQRIGQVTTNVNAAVNDVRRLVLTEEKLNRLGAAIDNFGKLTTDAQAAVSNVNALVATNALPVTLAVSNLNHLSSTLPALVTHADAFITNNEADFNAAIKNIENASVMLTNLLHGLQMNKSVAGRLLNDKQMGSNLNAIVENLSVTTSNLNRRGLWGIMWKQKEPRTNQPVKVAAPRDPFH